MEKIKVVGSTYMAACGLKPGIGNGENDAPVERDIKDNIITITAFAITMYKKLQDINKESFQSFNLRVGKCV